MFGGAFAAGNILAYAIMPALIGWTWRIPYLATAAVGLLLFVLTLMLNGTKQPRRPPLCPCLRWYAYAGLDHGAVPRPVVWLHGHPGQLGPVHAGGIIRATSARAFAWLGALIMLIGGISRLAGGPILYRVRPLTMAVVTIIIVGVGYVGLSLAPVPWMVLASAIVVAWFASINFGAIWHLAAQTAAPGAMGTVLGFINFLANLGAVAFTIMFGWTKMPQVLFRGGSACWPCWPLWGPSPGADHCRPRLRPTGVIQRPGVAGRRQQPASSDSRKNQKTGQQKTATIMIAPTRVKPQPKLNLPPNQPIMVGIRPAPMTNPAGATSDTVTLRRVGGTIRDMDENPAGKKQVESAGWRKIMITSQNPGSCPSSMVAVPAAHRNSAIARFSPVRSVTQPATKDINRPDTRQSASKVKATPD